MKCTVELLDMLGLYLVLTKLLGRSEMKVMITAVGKDSVGKGSILYNVHMPIAIVGWHLSHEVTSVAAEGRKITREGSSYGNH